MSKMIQVRNVPDRLHRELVKRAAKRRQTLSDFIETVLEREVSTPMAEEVLARIKSRDPVTLDKSVADIVNEERATRDEVLYERTAPAESASGRRAAEPSADWQA